MTAWCVVPCSDSPHSEPGTIDEVDHDNGTEPHTSDDGEQGRGGGCASRAVHAGEQQALQDGGCRGWQGRAVLPMCQQHWLPGGSWGNAAGTAVGQGTKAGLAALEGPWGAEHPVLPAAAAALAVSCFSRAQLPCEAAGRRKAHLASRAMEEGWHREGHVGPGGSGHREGHVGLGSSRPALSSRQEPTGLAKGGKGAAVQPISHLGGHVNGSDWGF